MVQNLTRPSREQEEEAIEKESVHWHASSPHRASASPDARGATAKPQLSEKGTEMPCDSIAWDSYVGLQAHASI